MYIECARERQSKKREGNRDREQEVWYSVVDVDVGWVGGWGIWVMPDMSALP
jgi:hypothetical protein